MIANRIRPEKSPISSGLRHFYDYRDLFGKVDAVSIAVPTPLHFEIGKAFLEQNIDVLIEKPITITVDEADELINIADNKGIDPPGRPSGTI